MSKLISLIKNDFKSSFSLSSIKYNFSRNKQWWLPIVMVLALFSIIPAYVLMIKGLKSVFDITNDLNLSSVFLLFGFLITNFLIFIFGLLYVMAKFYFSNDLSLLVPLPIKPSYILTSKFINIIFNEYLITFPISLPFIIIYGLNSDVSILYWFYAIIVSLLLPIVPLALASMLVMVFMKYTNIKGKKDLIRVVGGFISIIVILGVQFSIQRLINQSIASEEFLVNFIKDSSILANRLGNAFPPGKWATFSLVNSSNVNGVLNLGLFAIVSIISILLIIIISEKIFFSGLIGNMEVSSGKGKSRKSKEIKNISIVRKPYLAIALKETKMILRTPIYVLNSIGGIIILPIIFVMSFVMDDTSAQGFDMFRDMAQGRLDIIILAGAGFILATALINNVSSTTFSREGKNLWIQRILPIEASQQIIGRVLASLVIQFLTGIVVIAMIVYVFRISIGPILAIFFMGILGSITTTMIAMLVDIYRPLLKWDNPQQAMKQNLNVLISMGVGSLYLLAVGFFTVKVLMNTLDLYIIYLILAGIFVITNIVLYKVLEKAIKYQFENLE